MRHHRGGRVALGVIVAGVVVALLAGAFAAILGAERWRAFAVLALIVVSIVVPVVVSYVRR